MGQRLNIEIHDSTGVLANAYYHWSGFTRYAYEITEKIVSDLLKPAPSHRPGDILKAIRILESTGAGLTKDELEWLTTNISEYSSLTFPPGKGILVNRCTDRNDGIIGVSPKAIEETRNWEEGRVTIHLDTCTVDFKVYSEYTKEEFDGGFLNSAEVVSGLGSAENIKLESMTFAEFSYLGLCLKDPEYEMGVRFPDGRVYMWIE